MLESWIRSVVVAAVVVVVQLPAATYYVSRTGKDNRAGTTDKTAWKTINKVNATRFLPGDSILFEGGTTFAGTLYFDATRQGTAANPITLSSYGTGRATIAPASNAALSVYNAAGFRITNLNMVGRGRTVNSDTGLIFYSELPNDTKLSFIHIDNVEVSGFGGDGVSIGAWSGKSGFSDVRITNVFSHDNGLGGISVWGPALFNISGYAHRNVYIGYSKAYNNSGVTGYPRHSGNGIVVGDVDGAIIERSVAFNNGWLNTANGGPVGIWAWAANSVLIQYNESYGNRTASSTDGGGFDFDGGVTNSLMQYNYSHDNDGAGYLLCTYSGSPATANNTVRYNISQNDARKNSFGAIHMYGDIQNTQIHNNTVYLTAAASGDSKALYFHTSTTNIAVRNNIFVTANAATMIDAAAGQVNAMLQGNNYWANGYPVRINWAGSNYTSVASWRSATGQERFGNSDTGLEVDPMLISPGTGRTVNNADLLNTVTQYQLTPNSPMINAGLNLSNLFGINPGPLDYFGLPSLTGTGQDIGAAEYR